MGGLFVVAPCTVTVTAVDVVLPPSASLATAVNEYVPAGAADQVAANGAVVVELIRVVPAKKSTWLKRFSGSEAVALIAIVAGAVNVDAAVGAVSETVGGWLVSVAADLMVKVSINAVVPTVALWLVTASPTYTGSAIGTVSDPSNVQVFPSVDR